MAKQMEAHLQEESKLWSFVVLCQKQIMNARRESKERNLTWRIQEDSNCWTHFEYFLEMHNICRFEAREVRSPTLQTVRELELKRRSYGHLKTTASSCAKISQLRNQLRNQPFVVKISQPKAHIVVVKWVAKSTCVNSDICNWLS